MIPGVYLKSVRTSLSAASIAPMIFPENDVNVDVRITEVKSAAPNDLQKQVKRRIPIIFPSSYPSSLSCTTTQRSRPRSLSSSQLTVTSSSLFSVVKSDLSTDGDDVVAEVVDDLEEDFMGEALVMMVKERPLKEMWERLSPLVAFLLNTWRVVNKATIIDFLLKLIK